MPAATASLCRRKRRRNSAHWLRAIGSKPVPTTSVSTLSPANAPLLTAAAVRAAASSSLSLIAIDASPRHASRIRGSSTP